MSEEEQDYLDIYSVDPGIENMACARVKVFRDGMAEIVSSVESEVKEKEDQTKPGELIKKHKTLYSEYLLSPLYYNIFNKYHGLRQFIREEDPKKIVVLEENDNKYTKSLTPMLLGMVYSKSKNNIPKHVVKPKSVYSSMKRDMGWDKTMIGLKRDKKKELTRRFVYRRLINNIESISDDVNDCVLNALFIAKRLKFYKTNKKK